MASRALSMHSRAYCRYSVAVVMLPFLTGGSTTELSATDAWASAAAGDVLKVSIHTMECELISFTKPSTREI